MSSSMSSCKEIFLKSLSGEIIIVSTKNHKIVYDLKTTYNLKKGYDVDNMPHTYIIYRGERLHDLFLLDQLPDGATLHVICKLSNDPNKGILWLKRDENVESVEGHSFSLVPVVLVQDYL